MRINHCSLAVIGHTCLLSNFLKQSATIEIDFFPFLVQLYVFQVKLLITTCFQMICMTFESPVKIENFVLKILLILINIKNDILFRN